MIDSILMSVALVTTANLSMDVSSWRSINDGVMGGLSAGGMEQTREGLRFSGRLSLENNGGFSSVRRLVTRDLSQATRVRLEVRGDGREYQFRIREDDRFDGVSWRARFAAGKQWQVFEFALDDFIPVYRGRLVRESGLLDPSKIQQVGFLLADNTPGRFGLDVRRIEFLTPADQITP